MPIAFRVRMRDDGQSIEIRCPDCGTLLREQSHVRGEFTSLYCSCCATMFHLEPAPPRRTGDLHHVHAAATRREAEAGGSDSIPGRIPRDAKT